VAFFCTVAWLADMDGLTVSMWLLVGLVAAAAVFLIFRKKGMGKKPRIKILPKEKVVIRAAGVQHCPACRLPLEEGQAKSRCTKNSKHVVHRDRCKDFVQGKCPMCNNPLD
jgi:uncharacterized membrane protein